MLVNNPIHQIIQNNNSNIFYFLDILGIKYKHSQNEKGWIPIICPFHIDKDFGNAFINIYTGVIHCFNCGEKKHINVLLKDNNLIFNKITKINENKSKKQNKTFNFITREIENIDMPLYLHLRGFTEEFCKEFNIHYCISQPYTDYILIPIIDSQKEIYEFEFRKCYEYEYLQKIFKSRQGDSLQNLKEYFKKLCKKQNIKFTNGKLYKNGQVWYSSVFEYLLKPKVLYLSNSQVKKTIFNKDNLNYNEPLYLCEGTGSIPKLYQYISKNCSCVFGSEVTQEQLQILKNFKEIIIIPDNDSAGYKFVSFLHKFLSPFVKLYVIPLNVDDTDVNYISQIKNTNKLEINSFLVKNYLLSMIQK